MSFKDKIAFIVPTKDNPTDLQKLLESLQNQTHKIDQLMIVDGSDDPIKYLVEQYNNLNIEYLRVYPPGLTKQRNAGIENINNNINLVGFLDDDVVLENDAIEKMLDFWESAADKIGGASFNILNIPSERSTMLTRLFFISGKQGSILKSGFNVILQPVLKDMFVQWLCGGATVWRREIFTIYRFDEWFAGCSYIEDLDFSFRVGQKYKLAVLAEPKLSHFMKTVTGNKNYYLEMANVINRYYFVKKHRQFSLFLFFWALFGRIAFNLIKGTAERQKDRFYTALGSIHGLMLIVTKNNSIKKREFFK